MMDVWQLAWQHLKLNKQNTPKGHLEPFVSALFYPVWTYNTSHDKKIQNLKLYM